MTTVPTPSPAQKQQQQIAKQVTSLQKQGWGDYGAEKSTESNGNGQATYDAWNNYYDNMFIQAKPENISIQDGLSSGQKVEIPLTVQVPVQEAPKIIEQEIEYEQKEIAYDQARALEALQQLDKTAALSASGSMPFNTKTEAAAVAEAEKIVNDHSQEFKQEQTAAAEEAERIFFEKSEPLGQSEESEKDLTTSKGHQPEAVIEDQHISEPQEFKHDVDLVRHHPDLDFPYFFGFVRSEAGKGAEKTLNFVGKTITKGIKHWNEFRSTILVDLVWKQVFGFGKKKELSKEDKEKQAKQAANKRTFFDSLRTGITQAVSEQRRHSMKSRLEALNKALKRSNLSYEGDLRADGQISEAALVAEEQANSKLNEQQLLAEKQKKMMMAKPVPKKGPGITMSVDKSHNFNNAAKLAG